MDNMNDAARELRNSLVCPCGASGAEHCTGCDACPSLPHADGCPQAGN